MSMEFELTKYRFMTTESLQEHITPHYKCESNTEYFCAGTKGTK